MQPSKKIALYCPLVQEADSESHPLENEPFLQMSNCLLLTGNKM